MLSLVTAAEQQYRHDTWSRDRDQALLVSIRARQAAERGLPARAAAASVAPAAVAPAAVAAPLARAVWARPIGARLTPADACAVA